LSSAAVTVRWCSLAFRKTDSIVTPVCGSKLPFPAGVFKNDVGRGLFVVEPAGFI
jgi:hypothetical protein